MKTSTPGRLASVRATTGAPAHYLRRLARTVVLRAAVRGRLSWHVALPLLAKIGGAA